MGLHPGYPDNMFLFFPSRACLSHSILKISSQLWLTKNCILCHCSKIPGKQLSAGFRTKLNCSFVFLSIPLIWGAVLLLGLLVAVVVLFAVLAKRKGRWLSIPLSQHGSMDPMSASLAVKSRSASRSASLQRGLSGI